MEYGNSSKEKGLLQDVHSLQLSEVSKEAASQSELISIVAADTDPQAAVEQKVRESLQSKYWWLSPEYQEKGMPTEQIIIETGTGTVEVFNYGETLSAEAKHIIEETVGLYIRTVRLKVIPDLVQYILINNKRIENGNTGEEGYGYNVSEQKAVTLYPRSVENGPYRIEGVQSLAAVLIHELSHNIEPTVVNEWREAFGWKELDKPKELPGGAVQYEECREPERCVNSYATLRSSEDFCESMAAALLKANLDPERLKFLQDHILIPETASEKIPSYVQVRSGEDIQLPRVAEPIQYQRRSNTFKLMKRTSNATKKLLSE